MLNTFHLVIQNGPWWLYVVGLTTKGQRILDAWCLENRQQVKQALTDLMDGSKEAI